MCESICTPIVTNVVVVSSSSWTPFFCVVMFLHILPVALVFTFLCLYAVRYDIDDVTLPNDDGEPVPGSAVRPWFRFPCCSLQQLTKDMKK